ncbi:MAG TPA: PIN domain-containing protein [Syntrophaceae bacterium]|nr:PIN domain-containing protein [Syntrophaceae bacterium]
MTIFIDTSAFLAILNKDDNNYPMAKRLWNELIYSENVMVSNNYVLVESFALIQRRLGMEAVRTFQEDILPLINVEWINAETHRSGVSAFLAASKRKLSLVDCVSFEIMRLLGIKTAFTFDPHFGEQGYRCIP